MKASFTMSVPAISEISQLGRKRIYDFSVEHLNDFSPCRPFPRSSSSFSSSFSSLSSSSYSHSILSELPSRSGKTFSVCDSFYFTL